MLVHYVGCCILHRVFEYCFMDLNAFMTIYSVKWREKCSEIQLGPRSLIKTKKSALPSLSTLSQEHWSESRINNAVSVLMLVLFLVLSSARHFDGRLNSHIAFNLCSSLHITPFGLLFWAWRFTTKRNETWIQFWTILASQINYNKEERIVLGKNLLLSQGFLSERAEEVEKYAQDKHFSVQFICQFRGDSPASLSFFCLSSRPASIHLGSEIGETMAKGSRNMQHKL